jgi:hypothetical protein
MNRRKFAIAAGSAAVSLAAADKTKPAKTKPLEILVQPASTRKQSSRRPQTASTQPSRTPRHSAR